jgi:hypothetical protein
VSSSVDRGFVALWITDGGREWVEAAEKEAGQAADAVWASQLLSDDLMRWSRWWLGLGAFVVAFVAGGLAGALGTTLVVDRPAEAGAVAGMSGVLVVTAAALAGCTVVLWRLHRSGRRLARALRWWLALRADAVPDQGFAGWVAPRAVLMKPAVFVRVLTATISGLIGIFGFSSIGYAASDATVLLVALVLWGVLGVACTVGQMGGVVRLVNGLGDADPVWSRLRGR